MQLHLDLRRNDAIVTNLDISEVEAVTTSEDDYKIRLKKADLFLDDFVPTEYTDYLAKRPKFRSRTAREPKLPVVPGRPKRFADVYDDYSPEYRDEYNEIDDYDEEEIDLIEREIHMFDQFNNISTTARTSSPNTFEISDHVTSTSTTTTPAPPQKNSLLGVDISDPENLDLDLLREKIHLYIQTAAEVDPKLERLFVVFNETLAKPEARTIFAAFMKVMQNTIDNEPPDEDAEFCGDLSRFRILPEDNIQDVRWKQGNEKQFF